MKHNTEDKVWYIYEMHEVLSSTGKPYVGSSADLYRRKYNHRTKYKLGRTPELIVIDGPYYSRKEARRAEQPYRIANGWHHENEGNGRGGKKNVESGHIQALGREQGKKHVESGHLARVRNPSKAGKIGGPIGGKMLWVNKDGKNTRVDPLLLQNYLDQGWIRGMLTKSK
jgi:predicted GIY-YIG superfamily endonuclease